MERHWYIEYQEELNKYFARSYKGCSNGYSTKTEAYMAGCRIWSKFEFAG